MIKAHRTHKHEIVLTADTKRELQSYKRAVEAAGPLTVHIAQPAPWAEPRWGVLRIPPDHWMLEELDRNGLTIGQQWTLSPTFYERTEK